MNLLGIDPGTKHLGLALADGPLAHPLPSHSHLSLSDSAIYLSSLVKLHQVDKVVIGLPEGKIASFARSLSKELKKHLPSKVQLVFHPETLSTYETLNKLREVGASRKKLKDEHSYAACLILEDYLEETSL